MSTDTPDTAGAHEAEPAGRHELPPDEPAQQIGDLQPAGVRGVLRRGRSQLVFGALGALLCVLLGIAIVTQVRQNDSGDSLETARPADLLVLLDSLQQREAALNTEVADLQRTLASLQASGGSDQAAIENAQARLAALSILIGSVSATGPGVTFTIDDAAVGVAAGNHARCDQRAAQRRCRGDGGPGRTERPEDLCPGRR